MTAQTQTIGFIRLVAAPRNVRRGNRKADIDVLAASIAARGLLQNFCVTPGEGERFEVEAARAFGLVDNHKQRKAVFRTLTGPSPMPRPFGRG